MNGVTLIAEIGSNYDGDLETAKKYVTETKAVGADAVKFQTLRKEKLFAPQVVVDGSLQEHPVLRVFRNLELPDEWHFILKKTADECGIEFMSTPFYLEAVDLLERVGVETYKIASGDITFVPLLEAVGNTGKRVLLSTGASTLKDVERAVDILTRAGAGGITLLHCVSNYPPKWEEMNLRAMVTLKNDFGLPVGISDHTPGNLVSIAAVALGASVIEKHVTFDRSRPGPDHPFAMTVSEFGSLVSEIGLLARILGTGEKVPSKEEMVKQHRMRRGLYDPHTLEPTNSLAGLWLRPEHNRPF